MRILLTGAGGFIGTAFARAAAAQGHSIAGLLVPSERVPPGLENQSGMAWLRGTLAEAPWKDIDRFAPEACVHAAWVTTPGIYLESPLNAQFLEDSKSFLSRLWRSGTNRIIGLGTCVEYRITGGPLAEDTTPIEPTTTYARCKNELRLALEQAAESQSFRFAWARVFYPYGPGEHPSRLCSSIIQKLLRDEVITLKTPDSTKDYIFIRDLAAALLAVVESGFVGSINLGTGSGVSVREIARALGELLGKPDLIREASTTQPDPFPYIVADISRLRRLGWQPQYGLTQGLRELVANGHGA